MTYTLKLPRLGEGIFEAEVVKLWFGPGDVISEGTILADMQTDKAAGQLASPVSGKIEKILVKEGDLVFRKAPIMLIDDGVSVAPTAKDENTTAEPTAQPEAAAKSDAPAKPAEKPQPVAERKYVQKQKTQAAKPAEAPTKNTVNQARVPAMPSTRLYAKNKGVNINSMRTNSKGHITNQTIDNQAGSRSIIREPWPIEYPDDHNPGYLFGNPELEDRKELTYIRKFNSSQMETTMQNTAQIALFDEVDASNLIAFQEQYQAELEGDAQSFVPFFVKAIATTAKRYPSINASLDDSVAHFVYKDYINVSVEMNTVQGLFAPAVLDADKKSLIEIAEDIQERTEEIHNKVFEFKYIVSGTITVSDISAIGEGTQFFTPILHYPQAASLGLGNIQKKPVVNEAGEIVVKPMLPLSFVVDNRIVDRIDAVGALNLLKKLVTDPALLVFRG